MSTHYGTDDGAGSLHSGERESCAHPDCATVRRVIGYRIGDRTYAPEDVEVFYEASPEAHKLTAELSELTGWPVRPRRDPGTEALSLYHPKQEDPEGKR
jgi:hypothetical protein